jgi:hypothetical protein
MPSFDWEYYPYSGQLQITKLSLVRQKALQLDLATTKEPIHEIFNFTVPNWKAMLKDVSRRCTSGDDYRTAVHELLAICVHVNILLHPEHWNPDYSEDASNIEGKCVSLWTF